MSASKSGLLGVVNGQSTVRNWAVNMLGNPKTFVASNTKTGTGARKGARDWNGSFSAYGGAPAIMPGDEFTFTGHEGADAGDATWSGQAIVDQVALSINFGTQDIIAYTVNFSGNGELVEGTGAGTDATYPTAPPAEEAAVSFIYGGSVGGAVEITDVTQLTLTLSAANIAYVNSSTVENNSVWTKRRAGPKNWTCSIARENSAGLGSTPIGHYLELLITAGTGNDWVLRYGTLGDSSNLTVDIETGAIIALTHNITMNIAPHDEATVGTVTHPGGTWL